VNQLLMEPEGGACMSRGLLTSLVLASVLASLSHAVRADDAKSPERLPTLKPDSVARRIGIDEVAAEVLPADKAAAVKKFQMGGKKVAMVGDGVNDAPALATANVGIAIGAGTDVAIESAGIVLVRSDPRDVVGAIELSRATYRKMIQNLVWATAYNLVAIPVAGGLFVHWGFDLPMSVGAIAMSLSTIVVAANAQLLRRLKLQRATH
jgi:Cu2+-exporting ATPase